MNSHSRHQSERRSVHTIQQAAHPGRISNLWNEWIRYRHKNEGWEENPKRGEQCTGCPAKDIPDERCSGKKRARRDLPDSNRVDQLLVAEPAEAEDEVGAQEGEQDVAAPILARADFKKCQKQDWKTEGYGNLCKHKTTEWD